MSKMRFGSASRALSWLQNCTDNVIMLTLWKGPICYGADVVEWSDLLLPGF
jgi:hypothetical protein